MPTQPTSPSSTEIWPIALSRSLDSTAPGHGWWAHIQHREHPPKGWAGPTSFSSQGIWSWDTETLRHLRDQAGTGMSKGLTMLGWATHPQFILQRSMRQTEPQKLGRLLQREHSDSHYLDSWWPPSSSILQVLAWVSTIRVYKRIPKTSETYKDSIGYWSAELWFLWNYSKFSWLKLSYYGNLISKISSFSFLLTLTLEQ